MASDGLSRAVLAAFVVAILIQVVGALETWALSQQGEAAAREVSDRYTALHAARLLEAEIEDSQREVRGFIISGDPTFGSLSAGEWDDAQKQLAVLDRRLGPQERAGLDDTVTRWRSTVDGLQQLVAEGRMDEAVAEVRSGAEEQALQDVVHRVDTIADREHRSIDREEDRVAMIGRSVRRLTIGGDAFSLLLVVGSVAALQRDSVRRRRAEAERERLIVELRRALSEVHRLSGLLPVCSWCKRVRDDEGYWDEIESYVASHSDAEFTHGICPECRAKLEDEIRQAGGAEGARSAVEAAEPFEPTDGARPT